MGLDQADSGGGVGWMLLGQGKEEVTEGSACLHLEGQNSMVCQAADGARSGGQRERWGRAVFGIPGWSQLFRRKMI